jgi:hypothetical protein
MQNMNGKLCMNKNSKFDQIQSLSISLVAAAALIFESCVI